MPSKKLPIRLPPDHPIWKYPAGQRSSKAREAINLAFNLVGAIEEIRELVSSFDVRLKHIESMLTNGVTVKHEETKVNLPEIEFDLNAFTEL